MKKGSTPIIDALMRHAAREKVSLHVPGHHQGRLLPMGLATWLGQATKLDATELPGLDNLHDARGCIEESQQGAAAHYGSDDCFYSVNGATACVMAAMQSCVSATRKTIILLGPCHLSAWRGLVYADAVPNFVSSQWRRDIHAFDVPSVASLERVLTDRSDVAGVFLTSPTYQGRVAPVEALAELAHKHGVPLIVDEAHGAHFGLHPALPKHSVACGADIVVQSPHKTLPCLTQAAWMHVTGNLVNSAVLRESLLFLQTTSPSYLLLAALDGAQGWLHEEGSHLAEQSLSVLSKFRIFPTESTDPMRLWIPAPSAQEIRRLDESLVDAGVCLEYTDTSGALAIFGFGQPVWEYEKFFAILDTWQQSVDPQVQREDGHRIDDMYAMSDAVTLCLSPREVSRTGRRQVPLSELAGCILRKPIAPYPPGVPIFWPGQRIEPHHVEFLERMLAEMGSVGGIDDRERVEVCDDN